MHPYVDPKSSTGETSSLKGFAKGPCPSIYMVTDDLFVTPMSSISSLSFPNKSNILLNDVAEKVGLSILTASLQSSSALTNGLNNVLNNVKEKK
ncbi:DUF674 family protein [Quillaja saponaria]|uniref:DUF674 family protein n=1 Tax=Quillaja saponaria TaxID=32244 RepID=A0AAD7PCM6_QUISA|nr:DUF674 family protein [Quillaja saponaria]